MKRIKITTPLIATRAQAEILAGEIASLMIRHRALTNGLDEEIKRLREAYAHDLETAEKQIGEKTTSLQAWAEANPAEFAGKKSLQMTHAECGWRTGQPTLKTLAGWTFDRVLDKIKTLTIAALYVRTKEEVNKQAIIADREQLGPDGLRNLGLKVVQDEPFFVEPKLTDQISKSQQEAA
jgi:phage host-nuclease inhibitor protein Gam